mmetsp:Transcript_42947/g.41303  ORF Transcript_42947/g.41303 Transcript_42947/m.41303 type:complete len:206 (-) Transcript_42947:227-844(-)
MGPHLGDVIDVISVLLSFCLRDQLNIECPRGEVSLLDIIEQILGSIVLVGASESLGLLGSEALVALVGLEGVLHEEGFSLLIHPLVGVRAVPIHVSVSIGGSSGTKQYQHLMEGLGADTPEVPGHVGVLAVGLRVLLLTVDEVRELLWVPNEEHRRIVSNHIINSFLGVKLDGEASGVPIGVSRALLPSDGREPNEQRRLLPHSI